jgi:phosphatidylserine decarboxylase
MSTSAAIFFYDRRSAALVEEPIYARSFLFWSHNTRLGRWASQLLFRQPALSWLYGWYNRRRWSRRRILPFAAAMAVRTEELLQSPEQFASFNDFFTRRIDLRLRPVDPDPRMCVAPADGKVLAYARVSRRQPFRIKGANFSLEPFLGDQQLAARFDRGAMIISRLHLADYHHFHFPAACVPGQTRLIAGKLNAVAPYARRWPAVFYTENRRMLTLLATERFGTIAMIEVGAFTVGSIRQCFSHGIAAAKGEHKGYFELGGSTVVLLFEPGVIRLDSDLCERSAGDVETYVRFGEAIGEQSD